MSARSLFILHTQRHFLLSGAIQVSYMCYGESFPQEKKIVSNISGHQHPAIAAAMFKMTMIVLQENNLPKASLYPIQGNCIISKVSRQSGWELVNENDGEIIYTDWACLLPMTLVKQCACRHTDCPSDLSA